MHIEKSVFSINISSLVLPRQNEILYVLKVGRIDDPAVVEALLELCELGGLLSLVHLLAVLHLHAPSDLSLRFLHDQPLIPRQSFLLALFSFLFSIILLILF